MDTGTNVSTVEIVKKEFPTGSFNAAMFDFDGTLSLIRRNWPNIMIPMMVDILSDTDPGESRDQLHKEVEEFVMRLNGRQTIFQMIQLAEEVTKRGGTPLDPLDYKHQYHDLLLADMGDRIARVKSGDLPQEDLMVPESRQLLSRLREAGLTLYLASGTDLKYVREELSCLGLSEFFEPHVYGALDNYEDFSKSKVIQQILSDADAQPHQILAFGDGFVEIEETCKVGGVAIGVASEEKTRVGVNQWKRSRLINAGAHIIIGDYRCQDELLTTLGIG